MAGIPTNKKVLEALLTLVRFCQTHDHDRFFQTREQDSLASALTVLQTELEALLHEMDIRD